MSDKQSLLSDFKFSHIALLDLLEEMRAVARDYKQVKPGLINLRDQLFKHFEIQPRDLYRWLREQGNLKREELKILEFLEVDLKSLKVNAMLFFDKHPADVFDMKPGNYMADFNLFSAEISERIAAEEKYLLPLILNIE